MRKRLGSFVHRIDNMARHRYVWLCNLNDFVNQYHPVGKRDGSWQ